MPYQPIQEGPLTRAGLSKLDCTFLSSCHDARFQTLCDYAADGELLRITGGPLHYHWTARFYSC
jgi:hypothetical protein